LVDWKARPQAANLVHSLVGWTVLSTAEYSDNLLTVLTVVMTVYKSVERTVQSKAAQLESLLVDLLVASMDLR
jgi:hypothetical protein